MLPPVQKVLESFAVLTALVSNRIYQGIIPEDVTGDRCVWSVITQTPQLNLSDLPEDDNQRIQLDGYSSDPRRARLIGDALRDAMESVTHVVSGPMYFYEPDTKLHRWSLDAEFWTSREEGQAVPLQIPFGGVKTTDFNVDSTSRAYTLNVVDPAIVNAFLPAASNCGGAVYIFDLGNGDGSVNLVPRGSDTIGSNAGPFSVGAHRMLYSDGISNFIVIQ
jgi:hypothetical protein